MVHRSNLIVVVRANGKILREDDVNGEKVVTIPFGAEYDLQFKNVHSRSALVNAEVDGQSIIDGLIVAPNSEVVVERFFEGDMNSGHRLRFIQKTKEIQEHRGDRIDDGILRITYQFEEERRVTIHHDHIHHDHHHHHHDHWDYPYPWRPWRLTTTSDTTGGGGTYTSAGPIRSEVTSRVNSYGDTGETYGDTGGTFSEVNAFHLSVPQEDEGITVQGSHSQQQFVNGCIGKLETVTHAIVFRLRGVTSQAQPVAVPVTTREKITCSSCGKQCKSSFQFCPKCSTALR